MSADNAAQMSALVSALNQLQDALDLSALQASTQRKLKSGNNFWTAIARGTAPQAAAAELVSIVKREDMERAALKRSLSRRPVAKALTDPLFSAKFEE
jgi:hypothetical protein